jgi:hypothetical protein
MKTRGSVSVARDQEASPFSAILMRLCESTGGVAAALVDKEGETVDYAGRIEPFEVRIAAAELRLLLEVARASTIPGATTHQFCIRTNRRSFMLVGLSDGYAIVLQLVRGAFGVSPRALAQAIRELEQEAGLSWLTRPARERTRWTRVTVRTNPADRRRPQALWLEGAWSDILILGRYRSSDLARREVGYLARLSNGAEITLVREPLGHWFADDTPT